MENLVFCKKYQEELPAMDFPPLPGPAGNELLETVSFKAFEAWKSHQTTLINERRMDLSNPESRAFLIEEMHKFFNNQEVAQAEGFVEPEKALDDAVKSFHASLTRCIQLSREMNIFSSSVHATTVDVDTIIKQISTA